MCSSAAHFPGDILLWGLVFKNNHFTEVCSGSEAGSYLRLVDSCITQLNAQGPSRTCNEIKEEEEEAGWSMATRVDRNLTVTSGG